MHMADALLSPAVGGIFWAASAGTIAFCAKRVQRSLDDRKVPLMAVLGAFIFAAQMINFTIPATGSSGHLGGGMILAILLGPSAAFLTIASVLTIQALFFADGGLLALGCNIFNLGVFPCFLAYPLIYRPIAGNGSQPSRLALGAILAAIVGLQLGALGVVFETVTSGVSALSLQVFTWTILPIHLAIGLVEELVTTAVVGAVRKARPEILTAAAAARPLGDLSLGRVLGVLAVTAAIIGGTLSWFASSLPDGLEWSLTKATETSTASEPALHPWLTHLQQSLAILPGYVFRSEVPTPATGEKAPPAWPAVNTATSTSGLVGGLLTLFLAATLGLLCRKRPPLG